MAVSKLLCILWFAALVGASGHGHVRSNRVCFEGASSVSFMLTDKAISRNQPWGNPPIEDQQNCLDIRAGRHNTKGVASEFMSGLGDSNVLADNNQGSFSVFSPSLPGKLHFYVEGTLEMNLAEGAVECPSIRLAQGNQFPYDPWWVGSRSCVGDQRRGIICDCCNANAPDCRNGAQVKFSMGREDSIFRVELIRQPYATMVMQQGAAVSEFDGNGSAALADAAAAPRVSLAFEGNSTKLRGSIKNQPSSLSAAPQRSSISKASSATAMTAVLAGADNLAENAMMEFSSDVVGPGYEQHYNLNCYAGHGGEALGPQRGLQTGVNNVNDCAWAANRELAPCFVYSSESAECFLLTECNLAACESGVQGFDTFTAGPVGAECLVEHGRGKWIKYYYPGTLACKPESCDPGYEIYVMGCVRR